MSRRPAIGLGLLMFATFVAISSESLPVGLLEPMSREIHVSQATMGLLVSAYAVVVAVFAVPLTLATAALPRKILLLSTLVGYAGSNVIIALAPNFPVLVVGRIVGGTAHAVFFAVISGYAIQLVPPKLAGRAVAIAFAGSSLGFTLGVPLGTALGNAVGWRFSFVLLAAVALVLLLLAVLLLPSVDGETHPEEHARKGLWRSGFLVVGLANALVFLGHYVAYTYIAALLTRTGISTSALGGVFLVFGVAGILGLLGAGLIIDHRPRVGVVVAVAVMVASLTGLTFATHSAVLAIVTASLWAFGFGSVPTFFMSAAIRTKAATADLAGAMVNSSSNVGICVGSLIGAQTFAAYGTGVLSPVAAGLVLAGLVTVLVATRAFPARAPRENYLDTLTGSMPVVTASIRVQRPSA